MNRCDICNKETDNENLCSHCRLKMAIEEENIDFLKRFNPLDYNKDGI